MFIRDLLIANKIKKVKGRYTSKSIQNGRESTFVPKGFDANTLKDRFKTHYPERWEVKKNEVKRAINEGVKFKGLKLVRGDKIMVER
jgi:hypothetical protein